MLYIKDRLRCVMIYNFYLVKFMDIYYDIKLFLIFIGYYILIIMILWWCYVMKRGIEY